MVSMRTAALLVTSALGGLQASTQGSSEAVSVLLATLQELQTEATASKRNAGNMVAWCTDASKVRGGMLGSLKRQVQESGVAMQQVKSVMQQLTDEVAIAESARQDKDKRLVDAVSTAQSVSQDYEEEASQLESLATATQDAIRLVNQQMKQGEGSSQASTQAVSQLMHLTADRLTDDEKEVMDSVTDEGGSQAKPQALLQVLSALADRMAEEKKDAAADHKSVHDKLFSFTDHLNATILELQSQVAASAVEKSHRSRERAVLQSKTAELQRLAKAAAMTKQVAQMACRGEAERAHEASEVIAEEVKAVRSLLQLLPSGGSDLLGVADGATPSFLQVKQRTASSFNGAVQDLRELARNFPDEAAWFVVGAKELGGHPAEGVSLLEKPETHKHAVKTPRAAKKPKAKVVAASEDPLAAIAAFAGKPQGEAAATDDDATASSVQDLQAPKQLQNVYKSLGERLLSKEKTVSELERWCVSVTRDAKADYEATSRAKQRTGAKLNLAKVSALMSERDAGFFQAQQELIANQFSRIASLMEDDGSEFKRSSAALKDLSERLLNLATNLDGEDATGDQRKAADGVKAFVEQLDGHTDRLASWHDSFHKAGIEVSEADRNTQQQLLDDVRKNQRRLVKAKAEAQLLASLDNAKAYDRSLSDRYQKKAETICSINRVKVMGQQRQDIKQELAALQTSLSKNALA